MFEHLSSTQKVIFLNISRDASSSILLILYFFIFTTLTDSRCVMISISTGSHLMPQAVATEPTLPCQRPICASPETNTPPEHKCGSRRVHGAEREGYTCMDDEVWFKNERGATKTKHCRASLKKPPNAPQGNVWPHTSLEEFQPMVGLCLQFRESPPASTADLIC